MARLIVAFAALIVFAASAASAQQCSPACDLNGDGTPASPGDYIALFGSLGKSPQDPSYVAAADLDGSGTVTSADFGLMLKFCPLGR